VPAIPPPPWVMALAAELVKEFMARMLAACSTHPEIEITSWYRDGVDNLRVGGDPVSQHLLGLAVDAVVDDPAHLVAAAQAAGLVAVDEGDHVHVQMFPAADNPVRRILV